MKSSLRVVSYVRDLAVTDAKFSEFDRMLEASKGTVDAVLIASPEVLGDTFNELLQNLNKLASAELMVIIAKPSDARDRLN